MKVAEKTDEIATYTQMAGQTTQYVGKGMIAAGTAMASTAWGALLKKLV